MRLTIEFLVSSVPGFSTTLAASLDFSGLTQLEEIKRCKALEYLSLRSNKLTSISELAACQTLWVIDLTQNNVNDLKALANFRVLGTLLLGGNDLTLEQLKELKLVHIINLEVDCSKFTRSDVVAALPSKFPARTLDS